MNKYSLREIAELVGIFSIVAGLMLVAYELRQNSQLMRAQVFNERSSQGIEVFLAVAENILYQQVIGVMEYDDGHLGGAYNVLRRYEAIGSDSAPFSGHGPALRLERLIGEVEEMYGPSNQR